MSEDVDRLIEANGNLPGELMSFVFSMMTPLASLTKYNVGLYDVMDEETSSSTFCAWKNGCRIDHAIRARPPSNG